MHLPARVWFEVVPLLVMFGAFALIERYARRHPYGTGRYGEKERRRRAREARHQRHAQPNGQDNKARNEAVMAELLGRRRPETGPGPASPQGRTRRDRGGTPGP
jgi:hypothetical protein